MATAWDGDSCFTQAESAKLVAGLAAFGVERIQGVWVHYTSWKSGKNDDAKVKLRSLLGETKKEGEKGRFMLISFQSYEPVGEVVKNECEVEDLKF